ncbi:methyltransferase type 11 [candidate division KSB3 bacterium]|uniref:Methyltransferase type 11 n=1 Tax=candidate division KSB3 bacterium TaxID=2044937 RepID=A0A2G6E9P9_9BACT|nr:MAG: methyltransferase type 11 [candidate division KSB3 bacterium]PIE30861.1 MAG: methyltransferase type 11 [candidate division KSB3 bacterium]
MLKTIITKRLNRRAEQSNWQEVLNVLGKLNGKTIADIGSGGGFFTLKFSKAVGKQGKVYAIDNDKTKLEFIRSTIIEDKPSNIELILSSEKGISLAEDSVDLFFSRNSFHHIPNPTEYFSGVKKFLKNNGRIVIIDYKKTKKFHFINLFGHYSHEKDIVFSLENAGYKHIKRVFSLDDQSFNIFEKK